MTRLSLLVAASSLVATSAFARPHKPDPADAVEAAKALVAGLTDASAHPSPTRDLPLGFDTFTLDDYALVWDVGVSFKQLGAAGCDGVKKTGKLKAPNSLEGTSPKAKPITCIGLALGTAAFDWKVVDVAALPGEFAAMKKDLKKLAKDHVLVLGTRDSTSGGSDYVLTTWTMYTGGEDHAELSAIYFRSGATD